MIDMTREQLIPFNQLPDHLPKTNGKKINIATLYRWRNNGLHGVKLEVCFVGGKLHSSKEAILRFDIAVTDAVERKHHSPVRQPTKRQANSAHALAKRRLMSAS